MAAPPLVELDMAGGVEPEDDGSLGRKDDDLPVERDLGALPAGTEEEEEEKEEWAEGIWGEEDEDTCLACAAPEVGWSAAACGGGARAFKVVPYDSAALPS